MTDDAFPDLAAAASGSEQMGRLVLDFDWARTPLGPLQSWPQSRRSLVANALASKFPIILWLGPDLIIAYNDAYRSVLVDRHPSALGRPGAEVWTEIWPTIGPMLTGVQRTGRATWSDDLPLRLIRNGQPRDGFFTFTYSPAFDEHGAVDSIFCAVTETTQRFVSERRLRLLNDLSTSLDSLESESEVADATVDVLRRHVADVPFAAVFRRRGHGVLRLEASSNLAIDDERRQADTWALHDVGRSELCLRQGAVVIQVADDVDGAGVWLVTGLAGTVDIDDAYLHTMRLTGEQVSAALTRTRAYDAERVRADRLAEIDRFKNTLFANVSHEFRTPLTLLLAPMEERLAQDPDGPDAGWLSMASRNGQRLLRLVNGLLDLSRLDSFEMTPTLSRVDLARSTKAIAEMFEHAAQTSGLDFVVHADRRFVAAVDPDWWEQIVVNLLSNALKYTPAGSITVRVEEDGGHVVLTVADTGIGIPDSDIELVSHRFHRVLDRRARSHEGSGIGLALVGEFTEAMGGRLSIESTADVGTTVRVALPTGDRGPGDEGDDLDDVSTRYQHARGVFGEVMAWGASDTHGTNRQPGPHDRSVLVVDDNADMRAYLSRILSVDYAVLTAADASSALETVRTTIPDLVISDVMMPGDDGFALLRELRRTPGVREVPVVMLSARAGEDAAAEGIGLGADDYLVKPFSARQLLERVASRIVQGRAKKHDALLRDLSAVLLEAEDVQQVSDALLEAFARLSSSVMAGVTVQSDSMNFELFTSPALSVGLGEKYRTFQPGHSLPGVVAVRENRPIIYDGTSDPAPEWAPYAAEAAAVGVRAWHVVPMHDDRYHAVGSLGVGWGTPHRLVADESDVLREAAKIVSSALRRIQGKQHRRQLLTDFQAQLLQTDSRSDAAVVAVRYQPANHSLHVGGDWYDVRTTPGDRLAAAVGDVVGHGVPAAATMGQLRSALSFALSGSQSPGQALDQLATYARHVNNAACATAAAIILDPTTNTISWATAGHLPVMAVIDGRARLLDAPHRVALGIPWVDQPSGPDPKIALDQTSLVLLYTDGLVERRGEPIDVGLDRLRAALERHQHLNSGALAEALVTDLQPPEGYGDDAVVLVLRTAGQADGHFVDSVRSKPAELRAARARQRDWLRAHGADEADVYDVVLAVSEAMGNAIEHGSASSDSVVGVEMVIVKNHVHVEVSDTGRWSVNAAVTDADDRGRGLKLMHQLMSDVNVAPTNAGTRVTMVHRLSERQDVRSSTRPSQR